MTIKYTIAFRQIEARRVAEVIRNFPFGPEDQPLARALAFAFAEDIAVRNSSFNKAAFFERCGLFEGLEPEE